VLLAPHRVGIIDHGCNSVVGLVGKPAAELIIIVVIIIPDIIDFRTFVVRVMTFPFFASAVNLYGAVVCHVACASGLSV
jgi:hypothetical protein